MGTFTTELSILATVDEVWRALADIGTIYRWNPGVVASQLTTEQDEGIGASRHCDLGGNNYLKEEVVQWKVNQKLTMRITDTNLPFQTADIHFTLHPEGETTIVSLSPEYTLKFGLLGELLDRFYVRRTYTRGMEALLQGLKDYVETGK